MGFGVSERHRLRCDHEGSRPPPEQHQAAADWISHYQGGAATQVEYVTDQTGTAVQRCGASPERGDDYDERHREGHRIRHERAAR